MGMMQEFKEFAVKGNAIDLAVGVIIGAAFGNVVNSIVNDLAMPLINPLIPGGSWQTLVVGPGVQIGKFLAALVNFLIVAFTVFIAVKAVNSMRKDEPQPPAA